jgi:hypothetical protein
MVQRNPLLDSDEIVGRWLTKLTNISARLYASNFDVWEEFEPQRRRLEQRLQYLHYEGEIDLRKTTVKDAIEIARKSLRDGHTDWGNAAQRAAEALRIEEIQAIVESGTSGTA